MGDYSPSVSSLMCRDGAFSPHELSCILVGVPEEDNITISMTAFAVVTSSAFCSLLVVGGLSGCLGYRHGKSVAKRSDFSDFSVGSPSLSLTKPASQTTEAPLSSPGASDDVEDGSRVGGVGGFSSSLGGLVHHHGSSGTAGAAEGANPFAENPLLPSPASVPVQDNSNNPFAEDGEAPDPESAKATKKVEAPKAKPGAPAAKRKVSTTVARKARPNGP